VTIKGLSNGVTYTMAVAAYDNVNNIGPLSELQCATPQETTTFFNEYCADGGHGCGGCGSCAVGADTDLTWPGLAAFALVTVGLTVRRDERRRKQRVSARKAAETE
jgi:MYXO-CTERM domain-containing protein